MNTPFLFLDGREEEEGAGIPREAGTPMLTNVFSEPGSAGHTLLPSGTLLPISLQLHQPHITEGDIPFISLPYEAPRGARAKGDRSLESSLVTLTVAGTHLLLNALLPTSRE